MTRFVLILMLLFVIENCRARDAGDTDRQALYNQADLVFVGKLIKRSCCNIGIHSADPKYRNFSLASIEVPIKGLSKGEVIFNHQFGIIDLQPMDCCEEGARYLFYLQSISGSDWYNAAGQASMIKLRTN